MPAISFSTMKDKILNGEKQQTVRPLKTDYWLRWREGDRLVGYWKQRTEECEKLFEGEFDEDPFVISSGDFTQELAKRDGFTDDENFRAVDYMENWFVNKYTDDFINGMELVVIRWRLQ